MGDKVRVSRKVVKVEKVGDNWISTFETPKGIEVRLSFFFFMIHLFFSVFSILFFIYIIIDIIVMRCLSSASRCLDNFEMLFAFVLIL